MRHNMAVNDERDVEIIVALLRDCFEFAWRESK
jgi:hypothetical protein